MTPTSAQQRSAPRPRPETARELERAEVAMAVEPPLRQCSGLGATQVPGPAQCSEPGPFSGPIPDPRSGSRTLVASAAYFRTRKTSPAAYFPTKYVGAYFKLLDGRRSGASPAFQARAPPGLARGRAPPAPHISIRDRYFRPHISRRNTWVHISSCLRNGPFRHISSFRRGPQGAGQRLPAPPCRTRLDSARAFRIAENPNRIAVVK